jgi:hypothetical protein
MAPLKKKLSMKGGSGVASIEGGKINDHTWKYVALFLGAVIVFIIGFMVARFGGQQRTQQTSRVQVIDATHTTQSVLPQLIEARPQVVPPVYPSRPPEYPLRREHTNFQQMGVLVLNADRHGDVDGTPEPVLLPLFGRKQFNRDRWEYYCASDKYHMMRLPVVFENRDCQDDVGCNEIYNGQTVMVPDYGSNSFVARIYKYRDRTNPLDQ